MPQLELLIQSLKDAEIAYTEEAVLSNFSTFRIGGPAKLLVSPASEEELLLATTLIHRSGLSMFVLGNGSNILFDSDGYDGVILRLNRLQDVTIRNNVVYPQAGASLRQVARMAREAGLAGFNFASGIPGSIGGAIAMNAGCYGYEMKDVLLEGRVLDLQNDEVQKWSVSDFGFGTRESRLLKDNRYILLDAVIALVPGNAHALQEEYETLQAKRASSQPLMYPSAGSVFKRKDGYEPTAKLIDVAGLKGLSVGDAQVSPMHAGFIVNMGHATSGDVLTLVRMIQDAVEKQNGFRPEMEIRVVKKES